MQEMKLISIWRTQKTKDESVGFHSHKYHELVYYPRGCGETVIGGKLFRFSEDTFTVIPPEVEHNESYQSDIEAFCITFDSPKTLPVAFYADTDRSVQKIIEELFCEVEKQPYGYQEMLSLKLNEILLCILRLKNNESTGTKSFEYIINYLRENCQEKINLPDCAARLHISYEYFRHKFKDITGMSPQQYLMESRLSAAADLLHSSTLNCTEIAYRCGFSTSAQFSALFRKRYGLSPLQFKKGK